MAKLHHHLRPFVIGALYFLAAAMAARFARFDGGAAFIWLSGALLLAELSILPLGRWRAPIVLCSLGGAAATAWFGIGTAAAPLMGMLTVAEAVLAAALLRRMQAGDAGFGSLRAVAIFAGVAGIVAPALSGIFGAAVIARATGMPYWPNLLHWFAAHALGAIAFTPMLMLVLSGELFAQVATLGRARQLEAIALVLAMTGISVLVFVQSAFPILFLPMLPMIVAAFRFGRYGAAVSIVILAVTGGALTLHGHGPIYLVQGAIGARALFFQFYLAATVLMALPVAAELSQRERLFLALRESEARYRLIADGSSDVILTLAIDGTISFVSPSIEELGGFDPAALLGTNARALVALEDRARVDAVHLKALADPGSTFIVEYRALTAQGESIWCETHTRGIVDETGRVLGVVSAIRDISRHKSVEAELARAATTDPLTGLVNRRAFDAELERRIADVSAGRGQGCCAILDLDFFKRVNDQHGHQAGDRVLRVFAVAAAKSLREGDLLARLGGEEFGVILWGADLAEARRVCDRLRDAIAKLTVTSDDGTGIRFTLSGGIAVIDGIASRTRVLRDADEALYRAKDAGRNRLALAA